ncbi:Uncharacterised protein [Halioglobus japonicus]|nr:Uncharacterised protein [Halioglobus japonicus]
MALRTSALLALLTVLNLHTPAIAECDQTGRVAEGTIYYHGSPVGIFTWRDTELNPAPPFAHPKKPDGPAWFTNSWEFSVHAGSRYLIGQTDKSLHLHKYKLKSMVSTLTCETHADFTKYTDISFENGDYQAATTFCNKIAPLQYNGYIINRDQVRGEPELILCNPRKTLEYLGSRSWPVFQIDQSGIEYTGTSGDNFQGRKWNCLLNNDDLSDFFCKVSEHSEDALDNALSK